MFSAEDVAKSFKKAMKGLGKCTNKFVNITRIAIVIQNNSTN